MGMAREGGETNLKLGLSMGFGVFMGIVPLWGFQMLIALFLAYLFRLNKPLVLLFSNISIPPMIPFILFGSLQIGALLLNGTWIDILPRKVTLSFCMDSLSCYLVGSLVLAFFSGALVFGISYLLLHLRERKLQYANRKISSSTSSGSPHP